MIQILIFLLGIMCLASQTQAKTITVDVGDGGLVFKPDSVTADKGDMVQFNYLRGVSHSHQISSRVPETEQIACPAQFRCRSRTELT